MTIQPPEGGNILLFQSLRGNLRYYRTQAGYSQRQVAEYLGLCRSAYTYYETGKSTPSAAACHPDSAVCRANEAFFASGEARAASPPAR